MKKQGFTIIELIISVFILSVAVIAVYSAFSVMIVMTSDLTDRLTAAYLTQEGMEIIRNIRDTNWLNIDASNTGNWTDQRLGACSAGCDEIDYEYGTANIVQWSGSGNSLKLAGGFYNYTNGDSTKFKRKITITCLPTGACVDDYIMKIIVETSWDSKASILSPSVLAGTCGDNNCISAEETLYNWYLPLQ